MSKKVIIIGGEGNGGIIAACIEDNRNKYNDTEYEIAGFLNDYLSADDKILGYPVMGKIADIDKYISEGYYFMYAILIIGKGKLRESIYDKINIPKKQLATIIHKSAFIGIGAKIEPGVLVMPNSYVGQEAEIGESTILKAASNVSHHVKIGRLCYLSVESVVGAYVQVGKCSDISMGAKVLEKRKVGEYAIAGAASLVTKDIGDMEIHIGIPAKFFKKIDN